MPARSSASRPAEVRDDAAPAEPLSPAYLYRVHRAWVYRRCLALSGGDRELAEDVMQDVFVRVHEKWSSIRHLGAIPAWLSTVADRLCINRLKRERTLWGRIRRLLLASPPPVVGPSEEWDDKRLVQEVRRSLADLPTEERAVVVMKYVEGERQNTIARRLSCSEGQVSKLLSRAIARLRAKGWVSYDD